eukprot:898895-Pelagomonas_calceolata.AAC.4
MQIKFQLRQIYTRTRVTQCSCGTPPAPPSPSCYLRPGLPAAHIACPLLAAGTSVPVGSAIVCYPPLATGTSDGGCMVVPDDLAAVRCPLPAEGTSAGCAGSVCPLFVCVATENGCVAA